MDAVERAGTDIVADARCIPLPDGCADEVMAIHLVEHFYAWEVPEALTEWCRLLRPKGKLILELPDIVKACKNVFEEVTRAKKHPDQMGLWGVFGDPRLKDPYMNHKYGWTFKTLSPLVLQAGFVDPQEHETQFHPVGRTYRDFRLEAIKMTEVAR